MKNNFFPKKIVCGGPYGGNQQKTRILIGGLIELNVQTFQPPIVIYTICNLGLYHWR